MHAHPSSHQEAKQGLSRRDLLQGASAGIAATLAAGVLSSCSQSQQPASGTAGSGSPASMPQGFSGEELQRRWLLVRERMRQQGLDCLITPRQAENNADILYLTDSPMAGWAIFPLEGNVIALFGSQRDRLFAADKRAEGIDARSGPWRGQWSAGVIEALRDLDMGQARIGVGNLSEVLRSAEGGVSYTTFDLIRKAFPRARFDSAAGLLRRVKLVHSEEEIAVFEKVQAVSEAGLQALMEVAR
ncbi:MAG: aminopeptidase P family N-terminal domain-containing protein, partial [Acidobacteria bacterium]|nr:aminopeptidase P family N-terminal domain-containing protein [Acidobacteriota bacterium]